MANKIPLPEMDYTKTRAARRYKMINKTQPGNRLVAMMHHLFSQEKVLTHISEQIGYRCGKAELLADEEFRAAMYYASLTLRKDARHPVRLDKEIVTATKETITPLAFLERHAESHPVAADLLNKKIAYLLPSGPKAPLVSLHSQNSQDIMASPYALEKFTPYQVSIEGDVTIPDAFLQPTEQVDAPYAGRSLSFSRH